MKNKEILTIVSLSCLGVSLIASMIKKVPDIVKNSFFFVAIVLLAVAQLFLGKVKEKIIPCGQKNGNDDKTTVTGCNSCNPTNDCCKAQADWCAANSNTIDTCGGLDVPPQLSFKCCMNQRGCGDSSLGTQIGVGSFKKWKCSCNPNYPDSYCGATQCATMKLEKPLCDLWNTYYHKGSLAPIATTCNHEADPKTSSKVCAASGSAGIYELVDGGRCDTNYALLPCYKECCKQQNDYCAFWGGKKCLTDRGCSLNKEPPNADKPSDKECGGPIIYPPKCV